MELLAINSPKAPVAPDAYAQAIEVRGAKRWLFISGQVGEGMGGEAPPGIEAQLELAWRNIFHQLEAAQMSVTNIAKITVLLDSRDYVPAYRTSRQNALQGYLPALSVVIGRTVEDPWLVEIEAVAVG